MLTEQQLLETAARIAARASKPARVILFGSYALGEADEGSDIDLLVIERDFEDEAAEYLRLREAVGQVGVGVDLLLTTEREFDRRSQVRGTVHYWAKNTGRVLYDAAA
ncbi:nucleotidyltransferase domain-containing protein [Thermodesulfobacteriota bacterium]